VSNTAVGRARIEKHENAIRKKGENAVRNGQAPAWARDCRDGPGAAFHWSMLRFSS
jgi:hypothetical protein